MIAITSSAVLGVAEAQGKLMAIIEGDYSKEFLLRTAREAYEALKPFREGLSVIPSER